MIQLRAPSEVGTTGLPASYYTDPSFFAREVDKIHYRTWLYAGRADRIAAAGDFFMVQVGTAKVLVVRDESGEIHAFHNVCRHRGTLLCTETEGRFPGRVRCPYHAWTYRLDGTLANAPHMNEVQGFATEDFPLRRVALADWAGHLFINLSDEPQPFEQYLGGLDRRFAHWDMQNMRVVERHSYELRANWKLVVQNYHECLHCPNAHPELQRRSHYLSGDNEPPHPTWLGSRMDLREGFQTLSMSSEPRRQPLPLLDEVERRSVYYYALLPNLLINLHPDYVLTFRFNPLAVDNTEIVCEWLFHQRDVQAPGFDGSDAVEFWDMTNRQDWELSRLAQIGIGSRGYRPGPYSNREELLVALDRWVLDRVEGGRS